MNQDLPVEQYRLCFIREPFAYFTSADVTEQWGDDWDDAPYEYNAGPPDGDIIKLAFDIDLVTPRLSNGNAAVSVKQINAGQVAWLRSDPSTEKRIEIYAGTTIEKFFDLIEYAGGTVYVPSKL